MRKAFVLFLTITLVFASIVPVSAISIGAGRGEKPEIEAYEAYSYCVETGQVFYSKQASVKAKPASTTKLLSALVIMDAVESGKISLDDEVKCDKEVEKTGDRELFLMDGEVKTVKDLLYGMLLYSANDAAVALAKYVGGSVKDFSKLMNKKLKRLGCKDSHFITPNGLPKENHYASAKDMAKITAAAIKNSTIRTIISTAKYNMPADNMSTGYPIYNTNRFLRKSTKRTVNGEEVSTYRKDVIGGKTGTLYGYHEHSITFAAKHKGMTIIVTVLNSTREKQYEDSINILNYAEKNLATEEIFRTSDDLDSVSIKHGELCNLDAYPSENCYLMEGYADPDDVSYETEVFEDLVAPIDKDTPVGKVNVYVKGELYDSIDLITNVDVKEGWIPSYIGISNANTIRILVVILLLVILICVRKLLKKRRDAKRKAQERRKRRNKRRNVRH
ncbi:MAG: D-alanyl-D-alanine carboxypeptidase [Clostridia bacterium]|nr:D-alanyl-D-alanine carboxypeptidase [Clostridia bacterium]